MLPFQQQIVNELVNEDGLLILAKGLGMALVIDSFIQTIPKDDKLVFILNHVQPAITNEFSIKKRKDLYEKGGILSITSRILITDLLNEVIDFSRIKGVIILKADQVTESSTEHFILKLIHQYSKPFMKGFTEHPEKFVFGFNKIQKMLSNLHMSNIFLYPRYRKEVVDDIKQLYIEEHSIPPQTELLAIEHSIRDCFQIAISDLRNSCKWIDPTEISLDKVLTSNFEYLLKQELLPNEYKLTEQALLAIEEIKFFKELLHFLYDYDCISFLNFFELHIAAMKVKASWTTHFAATQIHSKAKDRVYKKQLCEPISYKYDNTTYFLPINTIPLCKDNAKWRCISTILQPPLTTLIITHSNRAKFYLQQYLSQPSVQVGDKQINLFLLSKLTKYFIEKGELAERDIVKQERLVEKPQTKRRRIRGTQKQVVNVSNQLYENDLLIDMIDLDSNCKLPSTTLIENIHDITTIESLKPDVIILYHPSLVALRMVELFGTLNQVDIHVLTIKESHEEQQCLSDVRREKDAFQKLILDKSKLAMPLQHVQLLQENESSRIAGGQVKESFIIVDVREFRSKLPLSLFNRQFKLKAITLSIGDYILSPSIAVERKVVSDLISSLNSSRLYTQAQQLTLNYTTSLLLIEFTESKSLRMSFLLKYNAIHKFIVLLMHFPKLYPIFSPSTNFSAELFQLLKKNKPEPIQDQAVSMGNEETATTASEFVKSMPGVNSFNYKKLIKELDSVKNIIHASKSTLRDLLGKTNGEELYRFLNKQF